MNGDPNKPLCYFLDTEFSETGYARIDLISIALVCDDGRELYMVMEDGWSTSNCSQWVKDNVLTNLGNSTPILRKVAKVKLFDFLLIGEEGVKPEIWGYYADYDWVLFCQLFGTMMDLPKRFPMYCRDIKQAAGKYPLPKQLVDRHNALEDARHIKVMYDYCRAEGLIIG